MANYSVKAFLEIDDKQVEVRRFPMTKSDAKSFSVLCEKLETVFGPKIVKNEYAIYWKDDEGDRIRTSSDEELGYAIKALKDDVFKIYVQPVKPNVSGRDEKNQHHGVICDGCDGKIFGFRYKCMECPDFDLCSTCESQGNHAEHTMMRFSSPIKPRFRPQWRFGPRHGRRGCGRHQQSEHGEGSASGARRGRVPRFGEPFHPYNFLSKMWSAFGNLQSEFANAEPNQGESSSEETRKEDNAENPTAEDYLRNIGETVAAVLDPLGIDVIVGVEHNGVRTDINTNNFDESAKTNSTNKSTTDNQHLDAETGVTAQKDQAEGGVEMDVNVDELSALNMDTNEWTYLDMKSDKNIDQQTEHEIPEMMSNVTINEKEPLHPDPVIAEATATMMSMGFTNENGWITSLLELNDGNIDRVFEVLAELGQPEGPSRKFIETFLALLKRNGGDTAKVVAIMQSMKNRK